MLMVFIVLATESCLSPTIAIVCHKFLGNTIWHFFLSCISGLQSTETPTPLFVSMQQHDRGGATLTWRINHPTAVWWKRSGDLTKAEAISVRISRNHRSDFGAMLTKVTHAHRRFTSYSRYP
ncbi:hypothetical protein BASA83_009863 [Batrachochytrium salamandrivorans]|nr:hypothetical protein BASA83_009863 [Batrachochytrium salamandrivorans]